MKWKLQETNFSCGPAALRNCMIKFGFSYSEKYIREKTKTDKDGTDWNDLRDAVNKFNFQVKEVHSRSEDVFGRKILKALKAGHACIMATDNFEHGVAIIDYKKRKLIIIDSYAKKEQKFTLKEVKFFAANFERETKKREYYFLEVWR